MHCGRPSCLTQILPDTWSNGRSLCTLRYRWPTSALKSKIKLSLKQSIWSRREAESPSNSSGLILLTFSVFVTVEQFYILLTGGNSMTLRSVKTLNLIRWKENSEGHQSGSVPGKINKQTEEFFFFFFNLTRLHPCVNNQAAQSGIQGERHPFLRFWYFYPSIALFLQWFRLSCLSPHTDALQQTLKPSLLDLNFPVYQGIVCTASAISRLGTVGRPQTRPRPRNTVNKRDESHNSHYPPD